MLLIWSQQDVLYISVSELGYGVLCAETILREYLNKVRDS